MNSLIYFLLFLIFLLESCKAASLGKGFNRGDKNDAEKNKALSNEETTYNSQIDSITKIPDNFNPSTITYSDYVKDFLDEQKNLPEKRPLADDHFNKKMIALAVVLVCIFVVVLKIMILKALGCNWFMIWCLI